MFLGAPGDESNQHTETRARSINDQGVVVGNLGKVVIVGGDIVGIAVLTAPDGTESSVGYELLPIPTT
ncbi:hypothetical protein [Actinophytocola sp.]|uniref:hypothetical protein n=1 Tax=Actinophytocola sp. TaxID=1872138 RepID=UPI00389AA5C4